MKAEKRLRFTNRALKTVSKLFIGIILQISCHFFLGFQGGFKKNREVQKILNATKTRQPDKNSFASCSDSFALLASLVPAWSGLLLFFPAFL